MSTDKDYYAILGVEPDADPATIEQAYERLSREVQPNADLEPTNPERMRDLDEAFDVLDDPARRAEYDRSRGGGVGATPPAWESRASIAGATVAADDVTGSEAASLEEPLEGEADGVEASQRKGLDGRLIAGIAMLVSGVALLAAGVVVLALVLTDDDEGGETQVTSTGVQYTDTEVGSGASPEAGQVVTINYVGRLRDGTEFDSSAGRQPLSFFQGGGGVIPGMEQGVEGMKVGGKRTIVIPPELAYGETGQGPIPPNATIIFDVELLAVSDPPTENPPEVSGEGEEREGVRFVDIVEGSGKETADGDSTFVHYTGWLEADGKRFDSSLIEPAVFPYGVGAGATIPGWDIGIPGMREGGKRRLIIPPELAYGAEGAGNGLIPPDATLIFDVELVEISEEPETANP